jgi:hypothetical protein
MTETSKTRGSGETAVDLEKIREDLASLREDLARLTSDAKGEISEEARRLYARLSDQGQRSATAISRGIEEQPLLTLLLAFGIGFIGGSLLRR